MQNKKFHLFNNLINNVRFEILDHGYLFADPTWKYHNINSSFNRLYFIINGEAYIKNKHHKVSLILGNVYLIPLDTTYDYICENHLEMFYIHFKMELFPGHDFFKDSKLCMVNHYEQHCIQHFINNLSDNNISNVFKFKIYLMDTIIHFLNSYALENIEKDICMAVKYKKMYDYIINHCSINTTIKDIAHFMNISVSALTKNFKRDSGQTIKRFIAELIIQKAKELLVLTDKSVKEISNETGFKDEFYFSRFFKKHTGISPSAYRKRNM